MRAFEVLSIQEDDLTALSYSRLRNKDGPIEGLEIGSSAALGMIFGEIRFGPPDPTPVSI